MWLYNFCKFYKLSKDFWRALYNRGLIYLGKFHTKTVRRSVNFIRSQKDRKLLDMIVTLWMPSVKLRVLPLAFVIMMIATNRRLSSFSVCIRRIFYQMQFFLRYTDSTQHFPKSPRSLLLHLHDIVVRCLSLGVEQ